jgi:hypothetical protein
MEGQRLNEDDDLDTTHGEGLTRWMQKHFRVGYSGKGIRQ